MRGLHVPPGPHPPPHPRPRRAAWWRAPARTASPPRGPSGAAGSARPSRGSAGASRPTTPPPGPPTAGWSLPRRRSGAGTAPVFVGSVEVAQHQRGGADGRRLTDSPALGAQASMTQRNPRWLVELWTAWPWRAAGRERTQYDGAHRGEPPLITRRASSSSWSGGGGQQPR